MFRLDIVDLAIETSASVLIDMVDKIIGYASAFYFSLVENRKCMLNNDRREIESPKEIDKALVLASQINY